MWLSRQQCCKAFFFFKEKEYLLSVSRPAPSFYSLGRCTYLRSGSEAAAAVGSRRLAKSSYMSSIHLER